MASLREQQIRALYRAALEQPPAQRASFVAEVTGDDEALRKSIELLLSGRDTDVGAAATPAPELAPGTLVRQYRIEGVLGRGGMGVVYRGTDTKLNRAVAIKFLSAGLADESARRRFSQEAETASGLNHPHIVTVYDVDTDGDRQFIVSELVDGGTLEDWANRNKRRSWRQSVELVTGVADALAAAHAAGVLHRDVKPSNVLIGANGYAKLADFGLAKLIDSHAAPAHQRTTRAGVVVGTVAYMSPEQATGQAVDARTDVFSFGVVLYELIAGCRPFEAASELEVLKSIASAAPAALPDGIPDLLRMALDKALEKDPADRYQTMRDFVADLRRVVRKPVSGAAPARRRPVLPWLIAAGATAAFAAALIPALAYYRRTPAPPFPQIRFELPIPGYTGDALAISPDGRYVTYAAVDSGSGRQVWIRPLAGSEARPLPSTSDARGVFWAPDSRQLAFLSEGQVKRIDIAGGAAQPIASVAPAPFAGSWGADGTILYTAPAANPGSTGATLPVARVSSGGGAVTQVSGRESTDVARGDVAHLSPRWLPDGEHFLYVTGAPSAASFNVYLGSVRRPERTLIKTSILGPGMPPSAEYSDGFLLYPRDYSVVAQPFDPVKLALHGEPLVLADGVSEFAVGGGLLAYVPLTREVLRGADSPVRKLTWVDRTGRRLGTVETPSSYRLPVLAPDGRHIAVSAPDSGGNGLHDIWTVDTERGISTRVTIDPAEDSLVTWSPDGRRIVFNSGRDGVPGIPSSLYERAANGAGADRRLFSATSTEILIPFDWSRDGQFILFGRAGATTWMDRIDLWVLPTSGEYGAYALLDSPFRRTSAKLSPGGRWIAYTTNETGRNQIVVQPFPDMSRGRWQISSRGGIEPRWRDDGREIVYLDADGVLNSVAVQTDADSFEAAAPQPLFATGIPMQRPDEAPEYLYDMTRDGQRFLLNEPVTTENVVGESTVNLTVIVNWASGLAAR